MTLDEQLAIIQAKKEGKGIEIYVQVGKYWIDYKRSQFDFIHDTYRIKHELPKPKYRPFKNKEEVMDAIKEHGSWLKVKESGDMYQVVGFVSMVLLLGQDGMRDCKRAFNDFTFSDGSPFGVKED